MDHPTDEKLVYEAFKDILKENNYNLRYVKEIKSLIKTHENTPAIAKLLKSQTKKKLNETVRRLIADEIFSSEAKAFNRFNEAVPSSATSTQQTDCHPSISNPSSSSLNFFGSKPIDSMLTNPGLTNELETPQASALPETKLCSTISYEAPQISIVPTKFGDSAMPTTLPFCAQYQLLAQLQKYLEIACFDFAQDKLPGILKENRWGCWQAAELDFFVKELAKQPSKLPGLNEVAAKIPITKLVASMTELRHSAVHRHYLTSSNIEEFLQCSEYFLALIADDKRLEVVKILRLTILDCLVELDGHEHHATQSVQDVRERMEARRLKLKRQEEAAVLKIEMARTRSGEVVAMKILNAIKLSLADDEKESHVAVVSRRTTQGIVTLASGIWMVILLIMSPICVLGAAILLRMPKHVVYITEPLHGRLIKKHVYT
ncbi:hypothetical protein ED733_000202 [Metarhizium rileyi]|uniref:Ubiquinol-cytochrome-c reductase cytochrome c1 n=1 Tax=Metarhizium rileyi (strain RCEF 4871) TaxID=1649241 RepID=A0A5C6FZU2_METRR|nr:hypothetical protein ED733_000202 [Metarhizium rileyi]